MALFRFVALVRGFTRLCQHLASLHELNNKEIDVMLFHTDLDYR